MGSGSVQGGQSPLVGRVAPQPQGGRPAISPAAPRVSPEISAAFQHRAQSLNEFAAAMKATSGSKLANWARQANHGMPSSGDAVVQALNEGIASYNRIHAAHQARSAAAVGDIARDSRKLEASTQVLRSLTAALDKYQAATAGMKGNLSQQWASAQLLAQARQDLAQQLRQGSMGLFEGMAAKKLQTAMLQIAEFCHTGVGALEGRVKANTSGQAHVQGLIQGRDQIDAQIKRLQEQQSAQDKASPAPSAQAKERLQASLDILKAERSQFNELIGRAIAEGPPTVAPPKTGFFKRLLPPKLRQHFQQNAITRHAAEGQAFKPKAGLEGGQALAAHLKGVFQRAGMTGTEVPSRRAMRTELTAAWAPVVAPKASPAKPDAPTARQAQEPSVKHSGPTAEVPDSGQAKLEEDWAALEREAEADVQSFMAERSARGLKGPASDHEIEKELKRLEVVDRDLAELEQRAEGDVRWAFEQLAGRQQQAQQLTSVLKQSDRFVQEAQAELQAVQGRMDQQMQVQNRLNDQVVKAFALQPGLPPPMSDEEFEREMAMLEQEAESKLDLDSSASYLKFEAAIRRDDAALEAKLNAQIEELLEGESPDLQMAMRRADDSGEKE